MPNFFGILFGRQGDDGWSEVYPITASDYAGANLTLGALRLARLAMMCADATLTADRLSDVDIKGDSYATGQEYPQLGTFTATPTPDTYNPVMALRIKLFAGTLKRGNRWARAIPNNCVSANGFYLPTSPFLTALSAYTTILQSSTSIATRIKAAVAPPFYTFTPITAATPQTLEKRDIGRPFGLPRGRRIVA